MILWITFVYSGLYEELGKPYERARPYPFILAHTPRGFFRKNLLTNQGLTHLLTKLYLSRHLEGDDDPDGSNLKDRKSHDR
jgi:hypothetical protein